MAKPTGLPKTGGRKKGTPNKRTVGLQEALESHGLDVVGQLAALLPQLEVEQRASVLIDLMGFLFPKRKAIESTVVSAEEISLEGMNIEEISKLNRATRDRMPPMPPEERARLLAKLRQDLCDTEDE
ncbi:MAG: hypothetical protein A2X94_09155 [Bdellovibrionales bacterium GWB1_55_8]|nr:MAG: hypothetical protein A2X94_09155 [Bdellovibrionales bacterium GWB1_55_8]